ncbi:MAG: sugar-transfer associated ATP-grasp domain-containing protein [Candidatus Dojkabacteria bacterium]|nr:sugar-transfer associated ATP-grasp domain-containing protein [Candidatus Dojkabacteria bacterium]
MVSISKIRKNSKKVLGRNERYLEYIRPHNRRNAFKIADDKVITKRLLAKHDIPVPKMIRVINSYEELESIDFNELPSSFVIKPVHGVRGGGVDIFYNRDSEGQWIRADKSKVSISRLKTLCRDIIDGKYSLNNEQDIVLIEERVKTHKGFRYHTFKGAPDIRIIVFNNIPVMAMLRLPTERSKGKANLDQGAIGSGIDMAVGKTTHSIYGKAGAIEKIPHTRLPVSGLRMPYWHRILKYSIEASKAAGLGFAAYRLFN